MNPLFLLPHEPPPSEDRIAKNGETPAQLDVIPEIIQGQGQFSGETP
jgi:hypothetical protein